MKHSNTTLRKTLRIAFLGTLLTSAALLRPSEARAQSADRNAVNGGIGFQVGIPNWSPGGFKWFNEYARKLGRITWLDFQLNTTVGSMYGGDCYTRPNGELYCEDGHWDGGALDFVIGAKLRFDLSKVPVVIDAKMGGAFDLLFFGREYAGIAFALRGGCEAHYFILDNLGVGGGIYMSVGPAVIAFDIGAQAFFAINMQLIGVEYRF